MNTLHPLLEIADHVRHREPAKKVAVIFDLDSTLFCVSPRTQHILRALAGEAAFTTLFPQAAEVLRSIEVRASDWGVREALSRTSIPATPELISRIKQYWGAHFFSSRHLEHDLIYPAALEYVLYLQSLGAEILYLTGREGLRMREGTVRVLRAAGFPLAEDSRLLMKPSGAETDEHYKVTALKELRPHYDHIWFLENEPVIIADVRAAVPSIEIVYVHSVNSGRLPAPEDLRRIDPDYRIGLPDVPAS